MKFLLMPFRPNFFQPRTGMNGFVVEYPPGKGNFSCALSNGQLNIKFCDIKAACVCNQPNKIEKRGFYLLFRNCISHFPIMYKITTYFI